MSRALQTFLVSLCFLLALAAAIRAETIAAPPTVAFLAGLSTDASCQGVIAAPTTGDMQPAPVFMEIYPICGVFCSEETCSGLQPLDPCLTRTGVDGYCAPHNALCPNELRHSPCTCEAY
jgi:hypothetical protein